MATGSKRSPGSVFRLVDEVGDAARKSDHDAGENQQRHAVSHAAFGDLLAQPHNESAASGEGEHGHQDEAIAGINHEIPGLHQAESDAQRLHRAENHGQIPRPLGDLLAAEFAFFLQFGERLIDHRQQLQNDGRCDVRHDSEGEDGEAAELASGEKIHETEESAAVLIEELLQLVGIHSGSRNVTAQAVNGEQASVNRMRRRRSGILKMF